MRHVHKEISIERSVCDASIYKRAFHTQESGGMADTTVGRLFPLATDDYRGAAWFARTFVGGKNGTVEWGGQASVGGYLLWFELITSYTNQQLLLASAGGQPPASIVLLLSLCVKWD